MFKEIATNEDLIELVQECCSADRYALDTEFHRESTYYPQLALLQIACNEQTYLIDPLEADISLLGPLMRSESLCVMHAGAQDLEILAHVTGDVPAKFADTQVYAGFLGMSSPSLAALHQKYLGMELAKSSRLTDWLKRPLTDAQKSYAASDVDNLLELFDLMHEQLEAKQRTSWAQEESDNLRDRYASGTHKKDPITRISEARRLKGRSRYLASLLANWREDTAAKRDVPIRRVMGDLAIASIAQKAPESRQGLSGIRGVDVGQLGKESCATILALVEESKGEIPEEITAARSNKQLDPNLKGAVALISTVLTQIARNEDLDPTLLSTRSDLEAFIGAQGDSRLSTGWRYEMAGEPIKQLLEGSMSVAFEPDSGLTLEARNLP